MKVSELFEEFYGAQDLFENLGNLNIIDKKFLKIFKTRGNWEHTKFVTLLGKGLTLPLGSNSPISVKSVTTASKAVQLIDQKDNFGLVLNAQNKQFFAAIKLNDGDQYVWGIDIDALKDELEDYEGIVKLIDLCKEVKEEPNWAKEFSKISENIFKKGGIVIFEGTKSLLNKSLTSLFKLVKPISNIEALALGIDATRSKLRTDRPTSRERDRSKLPATPAQSGKKISDIERNNIEQRFKTQFKNRLKDFKLANLKAVSNPKELIELLKEKGYLDKIKINNQIYNRSSSHLNLDYLMDKNSQTKCYVEYSIDWDTPEYEAMKEKIERIKDKFDEAPDKAEKLIRENRLPAYFKIYLKLEGGNIVPANVSIEKFGSW